MKRLLFQKITNRPKCNLFDRKDFPKILAYIIRSLEISFTAIELSNIASKFGRYSQDFIDYYRAPISLLRTNKKFLVSGNRRKIFNLLEFVISLELRISTRFRDNFELFVMGSSSKFYFNEFCRIYFLYVINNQIDYLLSLESNERFELMNSQVREFQFRGYNKSLRWQDYHKGKLRVVNIPFGGLNKK